MEAGVRDTEELLSAERLIRANGSTVTPALSLEGERKSLATLTGFREFGGDVGGEDLAEFHRGAVEVIRRTSLAVELRGVGFVEGDEFALVASDQLFQFAEDFLAILDRLVERRR
jgi:hypothetical protein